MKSKKPLEPILPGVTDFRPRLARFGKDADLPTLAAIRKVIGSKSKRSNSKQGWKGSGRIRPQRGFNQRVVVKARVVKMKGSANAKKNLRAHVQYLVRSGVSKAGESPKFFNSEEINTKKEISELISNWSEDRHHFRFIISPEKGHDLDLTEYTKTVVKEFEKDLGEKLTWFGTCHYNTDEPHIHVVVRGVGKDGNTLSISKDYIRHGLRELAQKIATQSLGERNELDLKKELTPLVTTLKWTSLDRIIEGEIRQSKDSSVRLYKSSNQISEVSKIYNELKLQRLQFLSKYDLSSEVTAGVWKVSLEAKEALKVHGRLATVKNLVSKHFDGQEALSALVVHDKGEPLPNIIRGEVIGVGFKDGENSKYLLISGFDGRNHFIEPSKFSIANKIPVKAGQIVKVYNDEKPRIADQVIKRFSDDRSGVFDEKQFEHFLRTRVQEGSWKLPQDLSLEDYLERFKTRISSLEETGIVKRLEDQKFLMPKDLEEQVGLIDRKLGRISYLTVEVDSHLSIKKQTKYEGATWLDDPSIKGEISKVSSLGVKVFDAINDRDEFLKHKFPERRKSYQELESLELAKLKVGLVKKYGKEETPVSGQKLEGVIKRYKILGTGIHSVIKTKNGFLLRKLSPKESLLPINSTVILERGRSGLSIRSISKSSNPQMGKGKGRK